MTTPLPPAPRRLPLLAVLLSLAGLGIVVVVLAVVLVANSSGGSPADDPTPSAPTSAPTTTTTSDTRCPEGQTHIDQGDCPQCFRGCASGPVKPIIYLYPQVTTTVDVRLSAPDRFTAQYPTYRDGWRVRAEPDGTLTDLATGRELYALYYESSTDRYPRTDEGFVVPGDQTASFLEDTLPRLGLNPREAEEFIVYWLPRLQDNPYTYIRFAQADEIAADQTLTITPQPDTLIRVMMVYQRLDTPTPVTEQQITTPTRTGFTAVEWGGTPAR